MHNLFDVTHAVHIEAVVYDKKVGYLCHSTTQCLPAGCRAAFNPLWAHKRMQKRNIMEQYEVGTSGVNLAGFLEGRRVDPEIVHFDNVYVVFRGQGLASKFTVTEQKCC